MSKICYFPKKLIAPQKNNPNKLHKMLVCTPSALQICLNLRIIVSFGSNNKYITLSRIPNTYPLLISQHSISPHKQTDSSINKFSIVGASNERIPCSHLTLNWSYIFYRPLIYFFWQCFRRCSMPDAIKIVKFIFSGKQVFDVKKIRWGWSCRKGRNVRVGGVT